MIEIEKLHELITIKELSKRREYERRVESERLLEGLAVLNQSDSSEQLFNDIINLLKKIFEFEDVLVLASRKNLIRVCKNVSSEKFHNTTWKEGVFLKRLRRDRPIALFDINEIPEWQLQSNSVKKNIFSALHMPLHGISENYILIFTHSERGFFSFRHKKIARSFSYLASGALLKIEYRKEMIKRKEDMEYDLKIARKVQDSLVSKSVPNVEGLQIEFRYIPFDAIGGDFFSFRKVDDGLGVFIGDVSGHGVSAALFLSLVKFTTDRILKTHPKEPYTFLQLLNKDLLGNMGTSFVTGVYAYISKKSENEWLFHFASGGHPDPILYSKAENKFSFLDSNGAVIGVFNDLSGKDSQITLQKGDRIYLYTDGVSEFKNYSDQLISNEELLEVFQQQFDDNLEKNINNIMSFIRENQESGPVDDDIILMGLEISSN